MKLIGLSSYLFNKHLKIAHLTQKIGRKLRPSYILHSKTSHQKLRPDREWNWAVS